MSKRVILTEGQIKYIIEHCSGFIPFKRSKTNPFSLCEQFTKTINDKRLIEGLIKSYPFEKIFKHIKDYLNFTDSYEDYVNKPKKYSGFVTIIELDNGEMAFDIIYQDTLNNGEKIKDLMSFAGYYETDNEEYEGGFKRKVFTPKFINKVNEVVYEKEFIYHITLGKLIDKIKKSGLCPRNGRKQNLNNPDRIYFLLNEPDYDTLDLLLPQMYKKQEEINDTVLLTIKTEGLNVNFSYDPYTENRIFTTDNIPPEFITKITKLNKLKL